MKKKPTQRRPTHSASKQATKAKSARKRATASATKKKSAPKKAAVREWEWHAVADPKVKGKRLKVLVPGKTTRSKRSATVRLDPALREAESYVEALEAEGLIRHNASMDLDATHHIERDDEGVPRLVRDRFSAI